MQITTTSRPTPVLRARTRLGIILSLGLSLGGLGGVVACGGSDDPGGGPDSGVNDPADANEDLGEPTVMASPSEGQKGVRVDDPLILTFNEPMNTASVEAAWSSATLPAAMMDFSWNNARTILTVDASAALFYAEGDIDVDTYGFEIKLDSSAEDVDGTGLAAAFTTTFDTARDITMQLQRVDAGTGAFDGNAVGSDIRIGDNENNATWIGFITIDLSELPTVVELTTASLFARQTDVVGLPYTDLGFLQLDQISPAATIDQSAYTAVTVSTPGVFSNSTAQANPGGDRSLDVLDEIRIDHANGSAVSRFRLAFDTAQDMNNDIDHVIFDRTSVRLDVRLLAE